MGRSEVKWLESIEGVTETGRRVAADLQTLELAMVSRMGRRISRGAATLLALWCGLSCPVGAETLAGAGEDRTSTSSLPVGTAAWAHLEALAQLGPRPPGSPAAAAAADYIRSELSEQGLDLEEISESPSAPPSDDGVPARILLTKIPGASSDLIVLFAPFDSEPFDTFRFVGANDGASGAAVLLELASSIARSPLPFTTWIIFGQGDRDPSPLEDPASVVPASQLLVHELEERGALSRVRLAVYLNQVGDRDLQISRDLFSDRSARRTFFREAQRLGFDGQFPASAPFDSLSGGHHAFWAAGMRRIVALSDDRFGGTESPGVYWHTEEDTLAVCDPASLEAVVLVTEAGLRAVTARFAKLDALSQRSRRPDPAPSPTPSAATQTSATGTATHLSPTMEWEAGP